MVLRKVLALVGPNVWGRFPVLEAWVDLGDETELSPSEWAELKERWTRIGPEHEAGWDRLGAVPDESLDGPPAPGRLEQILAYLTLRFQTSAGSPVSFGATRETSEPGVYRIAVAFEVEDLARAALNAALALVHAVRTRSPMNLHEELGQLRSLFHARKLGPSTGAIIAAARQRGIPSRPLPIDSLIQLGWGCKQRRIYAAQTDRTGSIAATIAQDKEASRLLLAEIGVPVPEGQPVRSKEEAWAVAVELDSPVVVKPRSGHQGQGVATNLTTRAQVEAAFEAARRHDEAGEVIVERFAPGDDYRLLVVGDKVIAAARRDPAQVFGNGVSTVAELVEEVNRDPRRGDDHATALTRINLRDPIALAVLAEQGLAPESIPKPGQRVLIRRNANLSTGGTATDVTDHVHPEVAARAIEAARVVGLDIAGIDVVARDISQPLEVQGGVIVEVNASPGLRMHLEPSSGRPRRVAEPIVDLMFAPGETGRIPVAAVTGTNGKTTTTRLLAYILRQNGLQVGMTCTEGVYLDDRRLIEGDCSGPLSALAVLSNPRVEVAVLETARGGILRAGLGFDRCDVAIVTNIGEGDHLGLASIETPQELARVKRVIVEAVAPDGLAVLNAADPLVVGMAPHCPGRVAYFARSEFEPVLAAHRASGGLVVFIRSGWLIVASGPDEWPIVSVEEIPITLGGRVGFHIENALAATLAAFRLGTPIDAIRTGLRTFGTDPFHTPSRFSVIESNGAAVIVDYGHNPSAVIALIEAVETFPHSHRTVLFSAAGDRRDCDLIRQGELLGAAFDHVILFEDSCNRGRADGEVVALLRAGVERGPRTVRIEESRGETVTVARALEQLRPGHLLVIQADAVEETLEFVQQLLAEMSFVPVLDSLDLEPSTEFQHNLYGSEAAPLGKPGPAVAVK